MRRRGCRELTARKIEDFLEKMDNAAQDFLENIDNGAAQDVRDGAAQDFRDGAAEDVLDGVGNRVEEGRHQTSAWLFGRIHLHLQVGIHFGRLIGRRRFGRGWIVSEGSSCGRGDLGRGRFVEEEEIWERVICRGGRDLGEGDLQRRKRFGKGTNRNRIWP